MKAFLLHQKLFCFLSALLFFVSGRPSQAASVDSALLADVEAYARGALRTLGGTPNLNATLAKQLVEFSDQAQASIKKINQASVQSNGAMSQRAIKDLSPKLDQLADVGRQVDKKFSTREFKAESFKNFQSKLTGNSVAEAKNVDKVIQQLCDAINESKTSDSKSCDVKSLTESQKNQLLLLAGKLATTGDGDKESLKTLGNQLATMGFKVQDSGSFTLLIAALASMHKANDFNEVAAMSSPAQSPATSSFADTVLTAGLQAPSQDKSLSGDWRKLVNESWASRDPLLPEVEYLAEPEVAVASSKPKISTQPEALAEVPNVAAPLGSTAIAPSNSDNRSNGFGFSSGEAPTIASTTSSQSSRDPSSEGPSTSEHSLSGANEVAARGGTGNPYNDANVSSPQSNNSQGTNSPVMQSPHEPSNNFSTDLLTSGLHEPIGSIGSAIARRPSDVVIPPEYDGTGVVMSGSPMMGGRPVVVLGGPEAPEEFKGCMPEGLTVLPKSEDDCNRIFKATYMKKDSSGNMVLDPGKFYRCMDTVVAKLAFEDEQRLAGPNGNGTVDKTIVAFLKTLGPKPEPSEQERQALIRNFLVTERMHKWGSCGALNLRESMLQKISKPNNGCTKLQETVFSVQSQYANKSRATQISEINARGVFESFMVGFQARTLGNFQESYSSLLEDQDSSNKVFFGLQQISEVQQKVLGGKGPLASTLLNLTSCFDKNKMGGYIMGIAGGRSKNFEETFGCSGSAEDSEKIKQALKHVAENRSTNPPCGKTTAAWKRLVEAKTPESRQHHLRIMNRAHSSQNFVNRFAEYAINEKVNGRKKQSENASELFRGAKGVSEGKVSVAQAEASCDGSPTCAPAAEKLYLVELKESVSGKFNDFVSGVNLSVKNRSHVGRTPASEKTVPAESAPSDSAELCNQTAASKQLLELEKLAEAKVSKGKFNPKEKLNDKDFSALFALGVRRDASKDCEASPRFKALVQQAELKSRVVACQCSHVLAISLVKNEYPEYPDCGKTLPMSECGEVLTNYSLYQGLLKSAGLKSENLKATEHEPELLKGKH